MTLATTIGEEPRRLPTMAAVADLLERAHACVGLAGDHWAALDGFDAAAASLQCREIVQLLEECGAIPGGSLPRRLDAPTGGRLLLEAAAALDEIPASDRIPRLTAARAALAGALLLHVPTKDSE